MLSKIATVTFIAAASAQYGAPAETTTTTAYPGNAVATTAPMETTPQQVLYYADYDNILSVSNTGIYYQSALTPEAVERTGKPAAAAAQWSAPAKAVNPNLYDAKGITLCGAKGAPAEGEQWDNVDGAKYKQVFVADAGEEGKNNGAVIGWDVVQDPMNPAAVKLENKWTVYQPAEGAAPVDVKCGPKNGLFIADKYQNAVNWVTYDQLVAKKSKPAYKAVVPAECGAAVADVRSLAYDEDNEVLIWSNNAAVDADAGVFSTPIPKDEAPAKVACEMTVCEAGWSKECSSKVKQVEAGEANKEVWAVADAWKEVQVSKGGKEIYDGKDVVAEVPQEATYAVASEDPKRDVLVVADQKEGEVYVVPNGQDAKPVGKVADVYGVAYNDAYGWQGVGSASSVSLAVGAVLAVAALLL